MYLKISTTLILCKQFSVFLSASSWAITIIHLHVEFARADVYGYVIQLIVWEVTSNLNVFAKKKNLIKKKYLRYSNMNTNKTFPELNSYRPVTIRQGQWDMQVLNPILEYI